MKFNLWVFALVLLSCVGETTYLNYQNLPKQPQDENLYPLTLLEMDRNIDILFVIDNSGSMMNIQQNVIQNAGIFMEQFAKLPYINWKIGLISTDRSQRPFLGFDQVFDYTLVDPKDPASFGQVVYTFQRGVSNLGVYGDGYELVFYNIKRALDTYNGVPPSLNRFLRDNSHLVVIMVSDEDEQSANSIGPNYEAENFYKLMKNYVASDKQIRFYGALSRIDLKDCIYPGDQVPYAGSQYERIINLSNGFHISACIADFGTDLAKIGKDITSLVGQPSLLLKQRPLVDTIKVYYQGKLIPPGHPKQGGLWYYEEQTNTINFYHIEFVQDVEKDHFLIEFDIDDGFDRG